MFMMEDLQRLNNEVDTLGGPITITMGPSCYVPWKLSLQRTNIKWVKTNVCQCFDFETIHPLRNSI